MRAAVFLDRDGVIIENRKQHVRSRDDVVFERGAFDALRTLATLDVLIVIITNQGVVGRGDLSLSLAESIQRDVISKVCENGGRIDADYLCPHAPDDGCDCRKPKPGMLFKAAEEHDIDLSKSYLVGDAVTDMQAGAEAGCRGILVQTGRGRTQKTLLTTYPELDCVVVLDLIAAVEYIARIERKRSK